MARGKAIFLIAVLAAGLMLAAADDKDDKDDNNTEEKAEEENCVLRVDGGDIEDSKSCFACAFGCLVTRGCKGMEWSGSPFVSQVHLANFTCPDAPTGDNGERLCVTLAEEDDDWLVIDASPKNCTDCVDACEGERDCDRMAWDYTLQDKQFLSTYKCPAFSPRPRSPVRAPFPANITDTWLDMPVREYSPFPTPSPAYVSPAPPKPCQTFNDKAERYDNSDKDCLECQSQCLGDQECAYVILNGTLGRPGLSVNRTGMAAYHCPGWEYAGNASAEYRCTVITATGKLMEAGDQNCTGCVATCNRWEECAYLYFNYDEFPKTILPADNSCPIGQVIDPVPASEAPTDEEEEVSVPIAGRRRL